MTRDEWLMAGQYLLDAHGPYNFRAYEVADVGRVSNGVTLQAPPPGYVLNAVKLLEIVLEPVRSMHGEAPVDVNSWYRDPDYNRAIGGAEQSMHLVCGAADINKRGWSPEKLALAIHREHPRSGELGIGLYKSFVHVDIRGLIGRRSPARWGYKDGWWT